MAGWGAAISTASQMHWDRMSEQWNKNNADANRLQQLYMSNTAHQREVKDLRAAGLNPILSATGGAGAAMGTGSGGGFTGHAVDPVGSYYSAKNAQYDLDVKNESLQLLSAQTKKAANEAAESIMRGRQIEANIGLTNANAQAVRYGLPYLKNLHDVDVTDFGKASAWSNRFFETLNPILKPLEKK